MTIPSAAALPPAAPAACSRRQFLARTGFALGGRVRTLREPFSDGLHAEAGAGRIPNTHRITLAYIKQFGLRAAREATA